MGKLFIVTCMSCMQDQLNKFVPRLRMFERMNAASYDCLKEEWECDPKAMARCTNAAQGVWEINDTSMGDWMSVCLLTQYCCCGNGKQYCQHLQLAEHVASCGNNPDNSRSSISKSLQKQAVYAAQQPSTMSDQQSTQEAQQLSKLLQVSLRSVA